jgi:hypothetical protein
MQAVSSAWLKALQNKVQIRCQLREFPVGYWKHLLVIAIFGIGDSSNTSSTSTAQLGPSGDTHSCR